MKKSTQIVGLPIISISEGQQVGKVKSLVINPDKGSIDFLTIEHEDWQVSVKAIPFKKVVGIGEYAVTVESDSAVIDLNEIPIANQLVNKKIKITNTKVMTRKGELLGEVTEYFIDDETGNILGVLLTLPNREVTLASDSILTYGKDIIIVKEDAASQFLDSVEQLINPVVANVPSETNLDEVTSTKQSTSSKDFDPFEGLTLLEEDEEVRALKEKQIEILLGKTVQKDIFGTTGQLLFPEGTVLTESDVMKAQEEGPGIVVELSMHVEA
ncbi:PRC-barrel domain-containing protein [Cytobacillus suaedae]|nr:PRC-barrel domain-containing protein [Cytobacillus suaedae]